MHGNEFFDLIGCISFNLPFKSEEVSSLPVYLQSDSRIALSTQSDDLMSFFSNQKHNIYLVCERHTIQSFRTLSPYS